MTGRNSVRSGPGLNLVLCEIEYRLLISVLSGVYLCWLIVSTKVFLAGHHTHSVRTEKFANWTVYAKSSCSAGQKKKSFSCFGGKSYRLI